MQPWKKDPAEGDAFEVSGIGDIRFNRIFPADNQLQTDVGGTAHYAMLGLDRGNPALTIYYATNPRYTGDFVQVHNWVDDETGELVYKWQMMFGTARLDPLSVALLTKLVAV
jgi:hypothetical protein